MYASASRTLGGSAAYTCIYMYTCTGLEDLRDNLEGGDGHSQGREAGFRRCEETAMPNGRRRALGGAPQLECPLVCPRGDEIAMRMDGDANDVLVMSLEQVLQLALRHLKAVEMRILRHAMQPVALG